ncbi:MAG: hypothetical protein JSW27_01815 [Phycisphaerales bacterium]|nr:MAG: hypothetical protein JSW27_01815 [Phycisphaerales bacterium]
MSVRSLHVVLVQTIVVCLLAGCTAIPPETLVVQKKTIEGIDVARRNQIALAEQIAAEKKERLRLAYEAAMPGVLKEMFPDAETYTEAQLRQAIAQYSQELMGDYKKIDEGKASLIAEINAFFDDLAAVAEVNASFLESSLAAQKTFKAAFDAIKIGDKTFSEYLSDKLDLEEE